MSKKILKIVKRYVAFDGVGDAHMEAKIAACENIDEVMKVFVDNGWGISHSVIQDIIHDMKKVKDSDETTEENSEEIGEADNLFKK